MGTSVTTLATYPVTMTPADTVPQYWGRKEKIGTLLAANQE